VLPLKLCRPLDDICHPVVDTCRLLVDVAGTVMKGLVALAC
jgi:hypothetical protein